MIGVDIRGADVGGLIRYLYGPGDDRRNVHTDPHIVGAWVDAPETLEPTKTAAGNLDFRPLIAELKTPHEMMTTPQQKYVMHVPLSSAPEDRILTDKEWADIAATTVRKMGLGGVDDSDGCRWVAIRHDPGHVHLVITLARQNGKRADPHLSKKRIGEACRLVEDRYGLRKTGRRDGTAAPRPTRGEVEKARRLELLEDNNIDNPLNPKIHLRETVQRIAARSGSTEEFLRNLRAHEYATRKEPNAFLVTERLSEVNQGQVTGYAVGLKTFTHPSETWQPKPGADPEPKPIFYGGSRLDRSLSLPRLEAAHGWSSITPAEPEPAAADLPKTLHKIEGVEAAPAVGEGEPKQSLALKLRRLCEHAAGESSSPAEYFAKLGEYGVEVKTRQSTLPGREDEITGYAVGLKGQSNTAGDDVAWISGSKVSKDGSLSLPKLQGRWDQGERKPATALSPAEREQIWTEATQATAAAVRQLKGLAGADVAELSDDIARSAADLLHSAATVLEPTFKDPATGRLVLGNGPVTEAARVYDRAQRVPYGRPVRPSRSGADLRLGAIGLGLLVAAKSDQAGQRIIFMMAAKVLMESIAETRISQLRLEAAQAARTAARQLERGIQGTFEPNTPEWYRAMVRNEGAEVIAGRDLRPLLPPDTLQRPSRGRGR